MIFLVIFLRLLKIVFQTETFILIKQAEKLERGYIVKFDKKNLAFQKLRMKTFFRQNGILKLR